MSYASVVFVSRQDISYRNRDYFSPRNLEGIGKGISALGDAYLLRQATKSSAPANRYAIKPHQNENTSVL